MQTLSWHTIEHWHTEKTSDWYWIVGIITVALALISIIIGNLIFAILIIVASFTLSLFASKRPRVLEAKIDRMGVTFGNTHYPYGNLESFWIETKEHHPRIIFKSKKVFMHFIVIFIEEVQPEDVRHALLEHLPEDEHKEPFLEKLLMYLGF
jgi:hypothetical protein